MLRVTFRSLVAAFSLAAAVVLAVGGCSTGQMADKLPDGMGLPADTPSRPAAPYRYPAVHDMPPARATAPMDEDQQMKLERELRAVRDRQEGREAPAKKAAPAPKKQPGAANIAPPAGAKANP